MKKSTTLLGTTYQFRDLKEIMAKANEEKSGDQLAGIAAADARERIAAKQVLADLTLADIRNNPLLDPEEDEVSRIIEGTISEPIYSEIKNWTVAELREYLLSHDTKDADIKRISRGLTSEMIAAVAKLMSNLDLITASAKITNETICNITIGQPGVLASRAQPNHPTDSPAGILASLCEALSYGIGDAVVGVNPVIDSTDSVKEIAREVGFADEYYFYRLFRRWMGMTSAQYRKRYGDPRLRELAPADDWSRFYPTNHSFVLDMPAFFE